MSWAVEEDLWVGPPGGGAGVSLPVSLPGTPVESHQPSPGGSVWQDGSANRSGKGWERRGFMRDTGVACCLRGAKGMILRIWQLSFFRD